MPKKLKFFAILLAAFWSVAFTVLLSVSLNYNILSSYVFSNSRSIKILMPEGWGFFTRNPQEIRTYYLVKSDGEWIIDPNTRRTNLHNLWGLKKRPSQTGIYYHMQVLSHIKKNQWTKFKDADLSGINLDSVSLKSSSVHVAEAFRGFLPEETIILKRRITPWAYRKFKNRIGDSVSIAKIKLIYE